MILGHAHPDVSRRYSARHRRAVFGAPTEIETRIAEKICGLVPSIERVRMVSSGTEATMSAIRLARGFTRRDKLVKFEGCYHGHSDSLLIKAGSGALTLGVPTFTRAFRPAGRAHDHAAVQRQRHRSRQHLRSSVRRSPCVIVEPIAGNMNCIPPRRAFCRRCATNARVTAPC